MAKQFKQIPSDFSIDDSLSDAVKTRFSDGMPCAKAFEAATDLGIDTRTLGLYADALDIHLTACQIGLFGYGKGKKLIQTLDAVDPDLKKAVLKKAQDKILSCDHVFSIADECGVSKVDVGSVCQTLGIKIKHCRFGAF